MGTGPTTFVGSIETVMHGLGKPFGGSPLWKEKKER